MPECSLYDIDVTWTEPEFDHEKRNNMTLTSTMHYLRSVVSNSAYGKPTTIKITRKIPS